MSLEGWLLVCVAGLHFILWQHTPGTHWAAWSWRLSTLGACIAQRHQLYEAVHTSHAGGALIRSGAYCCRKRGHNVITIAPRYDQYW